MRKVQMEANPMRNKPSVLNDNDTKGHRAVQYTANNFGRKKSVCVEVYGEIAPTPIIYDFN